MIGFLYNHFPAARKRIIEIAFEARHKPNDFSKLSLLFKDSKGKEYYGFNDPMDFPIGRLEQLYVHVDELKACMPGEDYDLFHKAREEALNREVDGVLSPDIAMLGYLQIEEEKRRKYLLHPEIILDLLACVSIRADEKIEQFDMEIHNQKKEQLQIDSKGHLFFFVKKAGLNQYLPFLKVSDKELKEYLEVNVTRLSAMRQQLVDYITPNRSLKDKKDSESNSES